MDTPAERLIERLKLAYSNRHRAYELREEGWTFQSIGTQFGVTRQRAKQMVDKAREERAGA